MVVGGEGRGTDSAQMRVPSELCGDQWFLSLLLGVCVSCTALLTGTGPYFRGVCLLHCPTYRYMTLF